MKKFLLLFASVFFLTNFSNAFAALKLESRDIIQDKTISADHVFNGFGCSGNNISPRINWKNVPQGTKSFALTAYDPDAPTGSGWWHWVVVNIPANYKSLPLNFGKENSAVLKDEITQVRNDFGIYNFGGPCPPKGDKTHHYIFTLYALKTDRINLPESATAALAGFMINQNVIEKAEITGLYSR